MACSGVVGIVIPPSLPMILLGVTAGISIGGLFLGGLIPGVLIGLALMILSYMLAKANNLPPEPKVTFRELLRSFTDSILALMTVVIIMGGILGGVFTATEAAIIAAIYSFIVGIFVYKELKLKDVPRIIWESFKTTGIVVLCIAAASSFGWILAAESIPTKIAQFIFSLSSNKYVILLLVNLLLLFLGTFLDPAPIIIILVPILFPIVTKLGFSPIYFGVLTVVNMAIGQCTPPVGVSLFVASSIAKTTIGEMWKVYWQYMLAMILVLTMLIFIPSLITFVPQILMRRR
jgi:C4-dicarboxylate transporter DctM subunit